MKYLKSIWADRVPNYNIEFTSIFEKLANKGNEGGDNEERATETGKIFATQYEMYIYAFFIGLYANEQQESTTKVNFGHKISEWGKKKIKSGRESFLEIQDFMFISLITKSDINFIELEQSSDDVETKKAISKLIELMESYANGGLQLIKDKLDLNESYYISSMEAPLNFLLKTVTSKDIVSLEDRPSIKSDDNVNFNENILSVNNKIEPNLVGIENNRLEKFLDMHNEFYNKALIEIKNGKKQSHWMWFIFPQIAGLGQIEKSKYFAISNLDEAKEYLNHEVLGANIKEISSELLKLANTNALEIFGSPDDLKLQSCMTLFLFAEANSDNVFRDVINKYFDGKIDKTTVELIKKGRN